MSSLSKAFVKKLAIFLCFKYLCVCVDSNQICVWNRLLFNYFVPPSFSWSVWITDENFLFFSREREREKKQFHSCFVWLCSLFMVISREYCFFSKYFVRVGFVLCVWVSRVCAILSCVIRKLVMVSQRFSGDTKAVFVDTRSCLWWTQRLSLTSQRC